jgi:hypothetical protein
MGYYNDLWKKQKESGTYQTRDGGVVTTTPKPSGSGANIVSGASADLGAGRATPTSSGGGNKGSGSSGSKTTGGSGNKTTLNMTYSAPTVKAKPAVKAAIQAVDGSKIATEAYKQKMAANQRRTTNQGMYDDDVDGSKKAVETYYGNKAYNQFQTRDGGFVQGKTKENPFMGATQTGSNNQNVYANRYGYAVKPVDDKYSRDTALWLLNKYGMTEADIGIPLEAMYTGNGLYQLPYLLKYPDNHTLLSGGKLITVGELKRQLTGGQYVPNTAAQTSVAQTSTAQPAAASNLGEYELDESIQDVIDAQNAQADAQIQALNAQKGVLNQQYDANAADLYAMYRRSGLAMPELMAGTATGIADSLTLQNDLNFQNNLAANELERAAAQNELSAQARQIQADADLQAAQTAADWAQMVYRNSQDNQNNGGNNDDNITVDTGGTLPGVTGSVSAMTKDEVVNYLIKRFYTALTPDNIAKALNELMANGLPESVAQAVAEKYGMEMQ